MRKGLSLMTAAGLLVAAPLMVSIALAEQQSVALDARERAPALALAVFQDMPGGDRILHGSYQEGLDEAAATLARRPYRDALVLNTNICVAQLKLGRLDAANVSCEAALASRPPTGAVLEPRKLFAAVHVNHGVVHFVQGDHEFAEDEFRRAKAMYPGLRIASSNLEVLDQSMPKARVEVEEIL